ncbi:JAB domain-containing protein [Geobacillus thermodenitrificans]|uniref:DNA repair protein RadC n=1 Tax=Geobacillus thermodenitrificans (strain NG80-2) TaxID=420246 RepID=A4ITX8_GEOTN|nr:DNA repair protein RadC [Geobacillus thermodenitrificans NG80-2]
MKIGNQVAHFLCDRTLQKWLNFKLSNTMCLNTKNEVVAVHRCHIGSLNASIVHPREVFKAAILNNAASIIVAHQHPSGDVTPSKEDVEMTKRLAEAGRILGIEVLDHLVINYKAEYTSLKERGFFS